jgi:2-keto-4-pentenoate hydratase/2-oxohepta-3-ene-1,7-dioic acid hydratase in catechol pathway
VRFISFLTKGGPRYGIATADGVIDLGARLGNHFPTLRDLLAAGATDKAESIARITPPDYSLDEIVFLPPIPNPEKIICVGVNYANRNAEYKDNSDLPKYPSIFMRTPGSLVAHKSEIVRPPESQQLDYEGEIAIVIGAPGRRVPEERAHQHIAGLTIMNEGTIRDWLRHGKFNVTQGKNFEGSGSIGPWLVTAGEFSSFDNLHITTRVNGEIRQNDTTANLIFHFPYLLRYLSTFTMLKPGDIIATGTPTGAGARFDPPRYLKPGDVVEVEVTGIGKLMNVVADEGA